MLRRFIRLTGRSAELGNCNHGLADRLGGVRVDLWQPLILLFACAMAATSADAAEPSPPQREVLERLSGSWMYDPTGWSNFKGIEFGCQSEAGGDSAKYVACMDPWVKRIGSVGMRFGRSDTGVQWTPFHLDDKGAEVVHMKGPLSVVQAAENRLILTPSGPFTGEEVPERLKQGHFDAGGIAASIFGLIIVDSETMVAVDDGQWTVLRRVDAKGQTAKSAFKGLGETEGRDAVDQLVRQPRSVARGKAKAQAQTQVQVHVLVDGTVKAGVEHKAPWSSQPTGYVAATVGSRRWLFVLDQGVLYRADADGDLTKWTPVPAAKGVRARGDLLALVGGRLWALGDGPHLIVADVPGTQVSWKRDRDHSAVGVRTTDGEVLFYADDRAISRIEGHEVEPVDLPPAPEGALRMLWLAFHGHWVVEISADSGPDKLYTSVDGIKWALDTEVSAGKFGKCSRLVGSSTSTALHCGSSVQRKLGNGAWSPVLTSPGEKIVFQELGASVASIGVFDRHLLTFDGGETWQTAEVEPKADELWTRARKDAAVRFGASTITVFPITTTAK